MSALFAREAGFTLIVALPVPLVKAREVFHIRAQKKNVPIVAVRATK